MNTENITFEINEPIITYPPNVENNNFGLTRYLYIIDDVKSSLVIAMLDKNLEEALFWAYELYFSGFKIDTFHMLEMMLYTMYHSLNKKIVEFLEKKKKEWEDTGAYCIVGTFIYNLIHKPYDITTFIEEYCKEEDVIEYINALPKSVYTPETSKTSKIILINIEQKDVVKYLTINNNKPYKLLKKTAKYKTKKHTLDIFAHEHGYYIYEQIRYLYLYCWLYYASKSPIWYERITKHGGKINDKTYSVDFETESLCEAFHDKYNLEPDEQSKQIQEKNIGTGQEKQISWLELYEKYA